MQYSSTRAFPVVSVIGLVVVALLSRLGVDWVTNHIAASGYPIWLPHLATIGQTVYAYNLGATALSYFIIPTLIFVIGYQYGKSQG